jgi:hypothetical protein
MTDTTSVTIVMPAKMPQNAVSSGSPAASSDPKAISSTTRAAT